MRKPVHSLSFAKAFLGIVFFLGIDLIALVLFEASVLVTALIAYGAVVSASTRIVPIFLAFMAVLLVTFVKGSSCLWMGMYLMLFWILIAFSRKYIRYSSPVRFCMVTVLVIATDFSSLFLAKLILNLLWICAAVAFFAV